MSEVLLHTAGFDPRTEFDSGSCDSRFDTSVFSAMLPLSFGQRGIVPADNTSRKEETSDSGQVDGEVLPDGGPLTTTNPDTNTPEGGDGCDNTPQWGAAAAGGATSPPPARKRMHALGRLPRVRKWKSRWRRGRYPQDASGARAFNTPYGDLAAAPLADTNCPPHVRKRRHTLGRLPCVRKRKGTGQAVGRPRPPVNRKRKCTLGRLPCARKRKGSGRSGRGQRQADSVTARLEQPRKPGMAQRQAIAQGWRRRCPDRVQRCSQRLETQSSPDGANTGAAQQQGERRGAAGPIGKRFEQGHREDPPAHWEMQGRRWVRGPGLTSTWRRPNKVQPCFDDHRGARIGEASNPGPSHNDDADSIADSDVWPDPELQWALEDRVDLWDEAPLVEAIARPPAPPELEEAANRAQAGLQREIARLRQQGIPAGHTWSAVLVPTIWLSLPVYCHRLLLPALVRQAVDLRPARRLTAYWQGQGVQLPSDLIAWLHRREDMGQRAEVPAAFGYFAALAQEQMLALAHVDQQLHMALCSAILCPMDAANAGGTADGLGQGGERCAACMEDMADAQGSTTWPGGCGHRFHPTCIRNLMQGRRGPCHCPLCGVDQHGVPRRTACQHGHYDTCSRGCLRDAGGCWRWAPRTANDQGSVPAGGGLMQGGGATAASAASEAPSLAEALLAVMSRPMVAATGPDAAPPLAPASNRRGQRAGINRSCSECGN